MLRTFFFLCLFIACWLWMQIVHELGHVAGAALTGGRVERVVLHPLTISRTDVQGSRQLLAVIWAGPIVGCLIPLLAWSIAVAVRSAAAYLFRFFAGFCLLANGLYLAAGSFDGVGDCGDLLRHGAPIWTLWLFGAATIPAGLYLWNHQGRHFGIGEKAETVPPPLQWSTILLTVATITVELLLPGG